MNVMAEEMSKERKEIVRLKNKSKTKDRKCGKESAHNSPDPSEAIEKRAAKYEELYDKALQEIQV